ncbi:hypothetical protein G6F37_009661 [Rhizopus arrhizus]|nr:hypothetical protein G6F38_009452 [Rhizopus arrhizus]KAG1154203.1 hypothetical protein G6F37_009661 [Rhizopus arrhizus]
MSDIPNLDNHCLSIDQLLTIKMQQNESIEAFTDRFQRIRCAAKWQDDIRTAALFKRDLPIALYKKVSRSLLNLPLNIQGSVCKVFAKARTVISSNICNDEAMAAGITKRNIINQSSASPISFMSGAEKSIHNPKNASGPNKQDQPQFKPRSKYLVHGNSNHTTEQCKVLKRIATANTATTATIAMKATPPTSSTKKKCYKCSANVPWSPDHATTCSRDKVKRFNGPTKAFRSARFSSLHNRSKLSPAAVNLNDQEHSHGSMDIDISSLPTNYDYSGASFSSIDIAFANKNNININNNVSGSIIFATNDNKSKCFSTTSKGLSLIYSDNDDALIHTSHIFEVPPLSFDTDAVIEKNKTAYRSPYRIPLKLMPVMQECVDIWLKDEVIEHAPPSSEWNPPLTLAPKMDSQGNLTDYRPCLDPRLLNSILVSNDKQPIPKIDEIFDQLQYSTIFTTLDLRQAFHRFQIYKPDRVKATFTFQEHIIHVQNVIKKLTNVNLILNVDKCHFAQTSVYLLGFCVDAKGSRLDPRKVTNALSWEKPSTGKDIQRFLGLVNYFRKYLPNLSEVTAPLNKLRFEGKLTCKVWGKKQDDAFTKTKQLLASAPVLYHLDLNEPFYVAMDASNYYIGAVLYQIIDKQICHLDLMARALSTSEKNYSTTKRELLAIVFALKKFHPFLWGNPFTLYTDHKALTYIHTQPVANSMMIQWLDTILDYDFKIIHRPGIQNVLPDMLSHLFETERTLVGDKNQHRIWITSHIVNSKNTNMATGMMMPDDLVTPAPEERQELLLKTHLEGHRGSQAMVTTLHSEGIHWTNLKQDALDCVNSCPDCQKFNIAKHGYHPLSSIYADAPWDHICIDTAGPMTTSVQGSNYILVVVDVFTRFCVLKAIPDKPSHTIALVLRSILSLFGRPKIIQSDNGTKYVNEIICKFTEVSDIDHRLIAAYHPRSNGIAERWVGKTTNIIYKRLQGKNDDWDLYLDSTQKALNNTPTALHGTRPFSLMFARRLNQFKDYSDVSIPTNYNETRKQLNGHITKFNNTVLPAIREKIKTFQAAAENKFNKSHRIIKEIPSGSQVMIKNINRTTKTDPLYIGNYTIVRKNQGGSYILVDEERSEVYDVEAVIDHKGIPGNWLYLVRWKGYDAKDDTWEPEKYFHNNRPILKYWNRRNGQRNVEPNSNEKRPRENHDNSSKKLTVTFIRK